MNKVNYYNQQFISGKGEEWDKAPGKQVILNASGEFFRFPKGAVVLDIGCGTGYLLNLISQKFNKDKNISFIGLDLSDKAIAIARERYRHLKFYVEDGNNTHFTATSIDAVISYGTLEHFDSPENGIKEIGRILKPSGIFLTMIPALGHYRDDRTDEGWYEDKTGQPQWNFLRQTWEGFFKKYKLSLLYLDTAKKYGAINPGCFFFGRKNENEV